MQPKNPLVERDGMLWPASDRIAYEVITSEVDDGVEAALEHVQGLALAVQAGGNCGVYPKKLARFFNKVITFEPDPTNFYCLKNNCNEANIDSYEAALGARDGGIELSHIDYNTGAHHIGALEGSIKMTTIDGLRLEACDLIMLDMEGFELFAISGARETIDAFKPVIMYECNGMSEAYHVGRDDIPKWLGGDYEIAGRSNHDIIMVPR